MIREHQIQNFRGFKNTTLRFAKGFNFVIGANGSGKSALLHSVKFQIGQYLSTISKKLKVAHSPSDTSDRNNPLILKTELDMNGNIALIVSSSGKTVYNRGIKVPTVQSNQMLPLFLYLDMCNLRIAKKPKISYSSWFSEKGYVDCLSGELDCLNFICLGYHYDNAYLISFMERKLLEIFGNRINVSDLVDGKLDTIGFSEKANILLVCEIMSKLYILNNTAQDPSQSIGVVLIDNFGASMHPSTETDFIDRLTKAFPNIQFIAESRSHLALNGFPKENIHICRKEGDVATLENPSEDIIGKGSEGILRDIFHVPSTFDRITIQRNERFIELKQKSILSGLSDEEQQEFATLMDAVGALGYDSSMRDPLYERLLKKRKELIQSLGEGKCLTDEELDALMNEVLDEWKQNG